MLSWMLRMMYDHTPLPIIRMMYDHTYDHTYDWFKNRTHLKIDHTVIRTEKLNTCTVRTVRKIKYLYCTVRTVRRTVPPGIEPKLTHHGINALTTTPNNLWYT